MVSGRPVRFLATSFSTRVGVNPGTALEINQNEISNSPQLSPGQGVGGASPLMSFVTYCRSQTVKEYPSQ